VSFTFIKTAFATLAFKAVAMIAGLAVSIVIARVLGPEGRGLYALIMTLIVMSASLGVFGLTASNTFLVARNESKTRPIGFQSLLVGLLGSLFAIAIVLLVSYISPAIFNGLSKELLFLTFGMIPLFLWGNLFAFAYLGRGKIVEFNTFETGQRVIFFTLSVVVLWHFNSTLEIFLSAVLVTLAATIAIYITKYFRHAPAGSMYEKSCLQESMAYGLKSYIATLLTLAVMRSGVLFVNYYSGNEEAGLFAVAQQVSELVIIVPTVIGTVLFGRISKGDSYNLTPKVLRTMTAIFLPITIIMFFASDWLVISIFGEQFSSSAMALKIMLPGAFLLGLEVIIANDIAGRGYPWPAVLVWIPVLIINAVGFVALIPEFGIAGASYSMTISFLVIFVLIMVYYLKLSKASPSDLFLIKKEDIDSMCSRLSAFLRGIKSIRVKEDTIAASTAISKSPAEIQSAGR
jgi:O-antigen/teichoic acid export membrane protein